MPGQMQFPITPGATYPEALGETPPGVIRNCVCPGIAFGGNNVYAALDGSLRQETPTFLLLLSHIGSRPEVVIRFPPQQFLYIKDIWTSVYSSNITIKPSTFPGPCQTCILYVVCRNLILTGVAITREARNIFCI